MSEYVDPTVAILRKPRAESTKCAGSGSQAVDVAASSVTGYPRTIITAKTQKPRRAHSRAGCCGKRSCIVSE
jgi:hypothetical protein